MNVEATDETVIASDKNITTTAEVSSCASSSDIKSNISNPLRRILQNHRLIWLNAHIHESNDFYQNALTQLETVAHNIDTFTDIDQCIDYLTDIIHEKVFMILSKSIAEQLISRIYDIAQLQAIYIFSNTEFIDEEQIFKDQPKVKGEYTQIISICKAIKEDLKQWNKNSIPISFVSVDDEISDIHLDELDSSFMYTQVFKDIVLNTEHNEQSIKNLVLYWRSQYIGNKRQLDIIDEFEREYSSDLSIWWYTRYSLTYEMLNRALRTLEADIMIKVGFFVCDLHRQLGELHAQQFSSDNSTSFIVYRGQGLSNKDFDRLMETKRGLMSFNSFLSTSEKRQVALLFAESIVLNTDLFGIVFKITVDPSISSIPYARIRNCSNFTEEEEILFSMHSVFRIGGVEKADNNDRLYQVELTLTTDDDQQLRALTNRIKEETYPNQKGWYRMTMLLIKMGQLQQAEEVCMAVQDDLSNDIEKQRYNTVLGMIKNRQGDHDKAVFFYETVIEFAEKTLPFDDPSLATPYNNIASVYHEKGEYRKALIFGGKALEIGRKTLPTDHPLVAVLYNNMAMTYADMGEYSKAINFYEQTLEIQEKSLPPNHPDLAMAYSNIGYHYLTLGEYIKALSFSKKSLKISERILPKNHPDLIICYIAIAHVYMAMRKFLKVIAFYEKALRIQQDILPPSHPDLANSFNNIGTMYSEMGENSKALSFYEKANDILKQNFEPNHLHFANNYFHVGTIYLGMQRYPEASLFFVKALEIQERIFSKDHPSLLATYLRVSTACVGMADYSTALSCNERALQIAARSLPSDHEILQQLYEVQFLIRNHLQITFNK